MLSFISRQPNKKVKVIDLFLVRWKQMNTTLNTFTTQTCAKKIFDHVYNAKAC